MENFMKQLEEARKKICNGKRKTEQEKEGKRS